MLTLPATKPPAMKREVARQVISRRSIMKRTFGWPIGNKHDTQSGAGTPRRGSRKIAQAIGRCIEQLEMRRMLSSSTPVAVLNEAYSVNEGSSIVIDGSGSHDTGAAIIGYKWDFHYDPELGFRLQATGNPVEFDAADDGPV